MCALCISLWIHNQSDFVPSGCDDMQNFDIAATFQHAYMAARGGAGNASEYVSDDDSDENYDGISAAVHTGGMSKDQMQKQAALAQQLAEGHTLDAADQKIWEGFVASKSEFVLKRTAAKQRKKDRVIELADLQKQNKDTLGDVQLGRMQVLLDAKERKKQARQAKNVTKKSKNALEKQKNIHNAAKTSKEAPGYSPPKKVYVIALDELRKRVTNALNDDPSGECDSDNLMRLLLMLKSGICKYQCLNEHRNTDCSKLKHLIEKANEDYLALRKKHDEHKK